MFKNINLFIPVQKTGDYQDLQFYYDQCLPGNSTILNKFDAVTCRLTDIRLNTKPCVLDMSKFNLPKDEKFLEPMLRTAAEMPREPGLIENLIAMIKRNFNAPELTGIIDIENTASIVVDKFIDSYFLKNEKIPKRANAMVTASLERWLGKQESSTIGQLANFDFVDLPAVDQYRHMIKRQPKQKLDLSIQHEYPSLQTIVYHSKKINAIFGPMFSELTRQLLESIDSTRFLFYTRKSPEQVEEFFSDLDSHVAMDVLELDVSKYDKSQNEFHCAVEYELWRRMGLDEFLASVWKQGHRKTTLKDYTAGIKTCLWYQRKSGDVTTFIGNTIIIAACMASMLPMEKLIKGAFCGDDSVLYFPKGTAYPDIQQCANLMWNFEAKLFKKTYGYFCGKYIIHHDRGVIVYCDPLKLISKLGAKHIKDFDALEEFRVSLCDVSKSLNNCAYYTQLDEAIREVHKTAPSGLFVYRCLVKYLSDKNLFKQLWQSV